MGVGFILELGEYSAWLAEYCFEEYCDGRHG